MPELNIEKTKKTLGQSIKRPPLSEKLLSKPPYRYLYDIMMEVNNVSGFFTGLFNEEELAAPTKETSKEIKISFLQKVIDVLQSSTGKSIQAKPSKIIAGHEPEKTNEMLQILGQALLDKISSKDAIEAIAGGRKPPEKKKPSSKEQRESEKPTSAKVEEEMASQKDSEKEARRKHRSRKEPKEDEDEKKEDRKEVITNGHSSPDSRSRESKSGDVKHRDKSTDEKKPSEKEKESTRERSSKRSRSHHKDKNNENDTTDRTQPDHDTSANEHATEADLAPAVEVAEVAPAVEVAEVAPAVEVAEVEITDQQIPSSQTFKRPSSAKGHRRRQVHADSDGADDTNADPPVQPPTKTLDSSDGPPATGSESQPPKRAGGDHKPPATPATSSAAAPEAAQQMVQSSMPRPMSSRPAAPRKRNPGNASTEKTSFIGNQSGDSSTQIIFDKPSHKVDDDSSDDDDEDDVVIVTQDTVDGAMRTAGLEADHLTEGGSGAEHGGLVQKILDTKKRDETSSTSAAKTAVTIDKTVLSREQEAISKRTRALQEKLQTLVKSAAPLKQIMNYVQEDVDTMRKELSFWSSEISKNTELLHREKQKTDRELAPLYEGLEFLDNKILETTDQIRNKKAAVIQNEQTIHKLLSVSNSTS